jgi:hypothetical protein
VPDLPAIRSCLPVIAYQLSLSKLNYWHLA